MNEKFGYGFPLNSILKVTTNSKHICPAFDYVFGYLNVCLCVCLCVKDEEVVLGRTVSGSFQ